MDCTWSDIDSSDEFHVSSCLEFFFEEISWHLVADLVEIDVEF